MSNLKHFKKLNASSGFTLIEMMVSVSIFIMVMVVAAGAILSITSANRKSQATKVAIDNLSFALESMSRHIRVGTSFSCSENPDDHSDCSYGTTGGGNTFSFMYKNPSLPPTAPAYVIIYRFDADGLKVNEDGSPDWDSFTSSDIAIDTVGSKFYVEGAGLYTSGDRIQPHVMITVKGTAGGLDIKSKTDFNLQTSVTQRLLDLPI